MLTLLFVFALLVGGIVAWHAARDVLAARVRGTHHFGPVVPFPDNLTDAMQAREKLRGKELLLDLGYFRWNNELVNFALRRDELRHFLVLGRTGSGKTWGLMTWLHSLFTHAKTSGQAVSVLYLSPHLGDLESFFPLLAEQEGLPISFIDLSGSYGITGWSPFHAHAGADPEEVANRAIGILSSALGRDLAQTPELREVMLAGAYCLLVDSKLTLDMLGDLLLDPDKGKVVLPKVGATNIRRFLLRLWAMPEGQRLAIVRHALPKFGLLGAAESVRLTLNSEPAHHLNLDVFLTKPGVLLFHPGTQKIGDLGLVLSGLFLENVRLALLRRDPHQAPLLILVVDEIGELLGAGGSGVAETISLLLSGARKTGTLVWLVGQDLFGQIQGDRRLASLLLSQASPLLFQLGRKDAQAYAKEIVLPSERPVLWPGDWHCEGARIGDLDPEKWLGKDAKKDRQDDTYLKLLSLPPRAFYAQVPVEVDGFVQTRTQFLYTHDRPEPKDSKIRPTFVGMRPLDEVRREVENRTAPWEKNTTRPASPSGRGNGGSGHAGPPRWT